MKNDNKMSLNYKNNEETNDIVTSDDKTIVTKHTASSYEIMEEYNILDFKIDEYKKQRIGGYDRVYAYNHKYELKEVLPMKILISRKLLETEERRWYNQKNNESSDYINKQMDRNKDNRYSD